MIKVSLYNLFGYIVYGKKREKKIRFVSCAT